MADVKITQLTELAAAPAVGDELAIVDNSVSQTKRINIANLFTNPDVTGTLTADGLTVDGDTEISSIAPTIYMMETDVTNESWRLRNQGSSFYIGRINDAKSNTGYSAKFDQNGDISFYEDTGTTPKFHWDASAESLGIGNATINTFYDTAVNVYGSSNSVIQFQSSLTGTASGDGFAVGVLNGGATDAYVWNRESSNLLFGTGGGEKMRIDSSGNVGIGTSSPSAKLGINASAPDFTMLQSDVVKFRSGVSGTTNGGITGSVSGDYFARTAGGKMLFSTNDGVTAHAVIDSSGFVSIGTSTPREVFHIHRPSSDSSGIRITNTGTGTGSTDGLFVGLSSAEDGYVYHYENNPLIFGTNNAERMRIDSSGNLLVGTTSQASTEKVSIRADSGESPLHLTSSVATGDLRLNLGTGTAIIEVDPANAIASSALAFKIDNSEAMRIDSSGNLLVGTTTSPSDTGTIVADGVYLGGTTSANLLDDYEEGTWTPDYDTSNGDLTNFSIFSAATQGKYTKVGNMVTVYGSIATVTAASISGTGIIRITGLPFAASSNAFGEYKCVALTSDTRFINNPQFGLLGNGTTFLELYKTNAMNTANSMGVADMNPTDTANYNLVSFVITYMVS